MYEQCIKIVYQQKVGSKVSIKFNGIVFHSYKVIKFLEENSKSGDDYIEFLPGVFIKEDRKYNNRFEREITELIHQKYKKPTLSVIYKLIFWKLLKYILYDNQLVIMKIKIGNKRDALEIINDGQILYSESVPIIDTLQRDYNKNEVTSSDYIKEFKWVPTRKIMYPFRSGGDGMRCKIKGIFLSLDLLDSCTNEEYVFFSEHEMFISSEESTKLVKECKKFKRCMDIGNSFLNNTYVQSNEEQWFDDIELYEFNGIYKIINANHRVCIAKRFDVPSVYAKVYRYNAKNKSESSCEFV